MAGGASHNTPSALTSYVSGSTDETGSDQSRTREFQTRSTTLLTGHLGQTVIVLHTPLTDIPTIDHRFGHLLQTVRRDRAYRVVSESALGPVSRNNITLHYSPLSIDAFEAQMIECLPTEDG